MEVPVGGGGEGLRCEKISAGGMWKCNLKAMSGELLCEKHYLSVRRRMRNGGDGGENSGVGIGGGNSGVGCEGRKRKRDEEEMGDFAVDGSEIRVVSGETGSDSVRKRGRPKRSKKKVLEENGCEEEPFSVDGSEIKVVSGEPVVNGVRKRGRPKGPKNKVKKLAVYAASAAIDEARNLMSKIAVAGNCS